MKKSITKINPKVMKKKKDNTKLFLHDLTGESVAEISKMLLSNGYDAEYIGIDENKMKYATAKEMGW